MLRWFPLWFALFAPDLFEIPWYRHIAIMKATFVAFDTETTGLEPESCDIIEIAGVKFNMEDDGTPRYLSQFASLVSIEGSVPPEASRINHITDDMLVDAPKPQDALKGFFRWCGPSAIVLAHNASFDVSFVGRAVHKHNLMLPKNPVFCTKRMACRLFPEMRHRLADLEAHLLGSSSGWAKYRDPHGAHRALYDSLLVMFVFAEMLKRRIAPDQWEAEKLLKILPGMGGERIRFDAPKNSQALQQEYLNARGTV